MNEKGVGSIEVGTVHSANCFKKEGLGEEGQEQGKGGQWGKKSTHL